MRFRRVALMTAAGVAVLVMGGCGPADKPHDSGSNGGSTGGGSVPSHPSGGRNVSVTSPVMAFRLHLTADEKLSHPQPPRATASTTPSAGATSPDASAGPGADPTGPPASPGCGDTPADWAVLERNGDYRATFEVDPPRCGTTPPPSGNGRRPLFHSIEDMTKEQLSQAHRFSIDSGTVVTFEQPYFECTQSCDHWREPVALITLHSPADRDYPTLVVRSDRAALDREDLERLVVHQLFLSPPSSSSTASPAQTRSSS